MILRPLFCFEDTKNTGLLIFNSLKQKKLIFNFFVNRYLKKLTDNRKKAKILADNRKSYHPIESPKLGIFRYFLCSILLFFSLSYLLPVSSKSFSTSSHAQSWLMAKTFYKAASLS